MSPEDRLSESVGRLYQEQGSSVRRFLTLVLGNHSVADELTQETFLHLWRQPTAFDASKGGIRNYLFGVARKKAADWWRRNGRRPAVPQEPAPPSADSLLVRDAFERLPAESKTILWLREVEGYSYDELSGILGVPVGTVRSRLHHARQLLRSIWKQEAK